MPDNIDEPVVQPIKRKVGRPKGSKNRKKEIDPVRVKEVAITEEKTDKMIFALEESLREVEDRLEVLLAEIRNLDVVFEKSEVRKVWDKTANLMRICERLVEKFREF